MIDILKIIVCILIGLGISLTVMAINREKIRFNNGTCIRCGHELKHFTDDSQGSRGYGCDNCDLVVWVSCNCVDKKHRIKENKK